MRNITLVKAFSFGVYKWNWAVSVRHHFEDDHHFCLKASQITITIHIMKAYDESYSKIIRGHRYKDKGNDKDNDKEKDTDKVPEKTNICYIFEILMTYSYCIS